MRAPERLGILADDFTGACDTAVAFLRNDRAVAVALPGAVLPEAPVLALDTASRALNPAAAQQAVRGALTRLAAAGVTLAFKKVDSTLRGQSGIELAALQSPDRPVLFCPAFPATGRTVVNGRLLVHGRPLHETEFGGTAEIAAHLAPWAPGPLHHVALPSVRSPGALAAAVAALGAGWAVLDAETEADLDAIVAVGLQAPVLPLFAGTGGLGAALARAWFGAAVVTVTTPPGPGLLLAGSRHPATLAQVAAMPALVFPLPGMPPAAAAAARLAWVRGGRPAGPRPAEVLGVAVRAAVAELAAGRSVLVRAPEAEEEPGAVDRRFAALTYAVLQQQPPGWLFATGGETARSACAALGAHVIELAGERCPGVVQGRLADGPQAGLPLIAKAGGFGAPDLLARLVQGGDRP